MIIGCGESPWELTSDKTRITTFEKVRQYFVFLGKQKSSAGRQTHKKSLPFYIAGGGVFFQAGVLFSIEDVISWLIVANLAILSQTYALFGVFFAGQNKAVAYQK